MFSCKSSLREGKRNCWSRMLPCMSISWYSLKQMFNDENDRVSATSRWMAIPNSKTGLLSISRYRRRQLGTKTSAILFCYEAIIPLTRYVCNINSYSYYFQRCIWERERERERERDHTLIYLWWLYILIIYFCDYKLFVIRNIFSVSFVCL